jgi:hypothetical protein
MKGLRFWKQVLDKCYPSSPLKQELSLEIHQSPSACECRVRGSPVWCKSPVLEPSRPKTTGIKYEWWNYRRDVSINACDYANDPKQK